jgi:Apea-like HEPN
MARNEELQRAWEAWFRAALPHITELIPPWAASPAAEAERSFVFRLAFLAPDQALGRLPETDALLAVVAEQPELAAALLVEADGQPVTDDRRRQWLLHEYLRRFATAYMKRGGTQSFAPDAFAWVYDKLEEFVYQPEAIQIVALAQYRKLALLDEVAIALAAGVVLRHATEDERRQAGEDPLGWNGDLSLAARLTEPTAFLEVAHNLGERPGRDFSTWRGEAPVNAASLAALRALRIIKADPVVLGPVRVRPDNPFLFFLEQTDPSLEAERLAGPGTPWYILMPEDAAKLQTLYPKLAGPPSDARLSLALARFDDAYARAKPEDRLVDYWVALEALFTAGIREELKYRASLRIAHFAGARASQDVREELFELIQKSYDWRSSVVHRADLDKEKGRLRKGEPRQPLRLLIPTVEAKTGAALRLTFWQCLMDGSAPDLGRLDKRALGRTE